MTIGTINWDCPACTTTNHDDIDDELGPFLTVTCDNCGKVFDQDAVLAEDNT